MTASNDAALDYYLLSLPDLNQTSLRLAEHNSLALDAFRFDTLDTFFAMAERAKLAEVAPW